MCINSIVYSEGFVILQSIVWERLAQKKISPPIVPVVSNEMDTSNFSEEFTCQQPSDSPAVTPNDALQLFRVCTQLHYQQFDYMRSYRATLLLHHQYYFKRTLYSVSCRVLELVNWSVEFLSTYIKIQSIIILGKS